ncbi:hypothetical protein CUN59_20860, partial [Cuspidothrix issatschenkoi CHARLIE-1]
PETAPALLEMAAAIARDRHYEIECLQIILVSRHISPAETANKPARTPLKLIKREFLIGKNC